MPLGCRVRTPWHNGWTCFSPGALSFQSQPSAIDVSLSSVWDECLMCISSSLFAFIQSFVSPSVNVLFQSAEVPGMDSQGDTSVVSLTHLLALQFAFSTLCSSPGTCTSTTSSLWNRNRSPIYPSWKDCEFQSVNSVFKLLIKNNLAGDLAFILTSLRQQAHRGRLFLGFV